MIEVSALPTLNEFYARAKAAFGVELVEKRTTVVAIDLMLG